MLRMAAKMLFLAGATVFVAAGCGRDIMSGPGDMGPTRLMALTPSPGAAGVSPSSTITIQFDYAMGLGMEQYVDLHEGDLAGPVVPMTCRWSGDRTVLTCTPQAPLKARTRYTVHLGGGMMDASGRGVDMTRWGMPMGGQWAQSGMMGATHAGRPWSGMGPGWMAANGSYGMGFTFTTA